MKKIVALIAFLLLLIGFETPAAELPRGVIAVYKRAAPKLALADMDANTFNLREAGGRWVFVHFWASWCGPCRREMPAIERLMARIDPSALQIVLINTAESDDTVFTFLAGVAPSLGSLMDRDGVVTENWAPRGLPATYLVDPAGNIRYQALGGRPWDEPPYMEFLHRLTKEQD